MFPLHTRAKFSGVPRRSILKVVTLDQFIGSHYEPDECALWCDCSPELAASRALEDIEWGALYSATESVPQWSGPVSQCVITAPRIERTVGAGDVIRVNERSNLVSVVFRRGSRNNSLFVTERCNSYCVMCSQPPSDRDDSSRVEEILRIVRLIDTSESVLGITGGEPTLLGQNLLRLLAALKSGLPSTQLHVLTNGRRFADARFVREIGHLAHPGIVWAIPLYSDSPEIHDYVVQHKGAFQETLQGFMNLALESQRIEIRVVLQQATVPRLRQLAHFISRNFSFVEHVAWMGLEPMGFARPNWHKLWVEPEDYMGELEDAVNCLQNMRVASSIYNLPLCVLSPRLRAIAAQSISDWKNSYFPECDECVLKTQCAGFFSSADRQHAPRNIRACVGVVQ